MLVEENRGNHGCSMVNLKLLASSSSFILWLKMLGFKLKRGCSVAEKEED